MSAARIAAIRALRRDQAAMRARYGGSAEPIPRAAAVQAARERMDERERNSEVGGGVMSDGVFRYPETSERLRLARTRDVVDRVVPGPDEDGRYLEMLARQAASIEVILRGELRPEPDPRMRELCDLVLLSKSPRFGPGASMSGLGQFVSVEISAGLIEFLLRTAVRKSAAVAVG